MSFYVVNICGKEVSLPIIDIGEISICFFNLHGAAALTEHCAKFIAEKVKGAEVILTAESKGLQLSHCVARELGHEFYAVARKSKKLYMQEYIEAEGKSITTDGKQCYYLSKNDEDLIRDKKVAIVDDVISTGGSLCALEQLVQKAGGHLQTRAFVLAEGDASMRKDIVYLAKIPLL